MTQNKFSRPPISAAEKEKKTEEFLGFLDKSEEITKTLKIEKEDKKNLFLRAPVSLFNDIKKASHLTGISINALCLESIRPSVKKKLKELEEND